MNDVPWNNDQELDRLIDRMCDQIASADELAELGKRLVEDPEACEHYIACLELHARLAWQMMPGKPFSPEELLCYTQASGDSGPQEGLGFRVQESEEKVGSGQWAAAVSSIDNQQSPIPPIVLDLSPTLRTSAVCPAVARRRIPVLVPRGGAAAGSRPVGRLDVDSLPQSAGCPSRRRQRRQAAFAAEWSEVRDWKLSAGSPACSTAGGPSPPMEPSMSRMSR